MYNIQIIRCMYREMAKWPNKSLSHFWRLYYNTSPGAEVNGIKLDDKHLIAIPPGFHAEQVVLKPFGQFIIYFTADYPFDRGTEIVQVPIDEHSLHMIKLIRKEQERTQTESKFTQKHISNILSMNLITNILSHVEVENNELKDCLSLI